MNHDEHLVLLTIIAGRKQTDALLTALPESGAHLINTTYARGSVGVRPLSCALGFVPEKDKAIITCVLTREKSDAVFCLLADRFHFGKSNTGISFTIPIDQLSF